MEGINIGRIFRSLWSEYKFVVFILGAGLVLMLLPQSKNAQSTPDVETGAAVHIVSEVHSIEEKLEEILSKLQGAGKVKVLLTESRGEETLYQTEIDRSSSESQRESTIIITKENRGEEGLIRRIDPPVYLGAVILSQGADKPSVRLEITQAVSSVTGLPMNRITVLKMK